MVLCGIVHTQPHHLLNTTELGIRGHVTCVVKSWNTHKENCVLHYRWPTLWNETRHVLKTGTKAIKIAICSDGALSNALCATAECYEASCTRARASNLVAINALCALSFNRQNELPWVSTSSGRLHSHLASDMLRVTLPFFWCINYFRCGWCRRFMISPFDCVIPCFLNCQSTWRYSWFSPCRCCQECKCAWAQASYRQSQLRWWRVFHAGDCRRRIYWNIVTGFLTRCIWYDRIMLVRYECCRELHIFDTLSPALILRVICMLKRYSR